MVYYSKWKTEVALSRKIDLFFFSSLMSETLWDFLLSYQMWKKRMTEEKLTKISSFLCCFVCFFNALDYCLVEFVG